MKEVIAKKETNKQTKKQRQTDRKKGNPHLYLMDKTNRFLTRESYNQPSITTGSFILCRRRPKVQKDKILFVNIFIATPFMST